MQGQTREQATVNDLYMALAHTVRDRLVEKVDVHGTLITGLRDVRVVCYLSVRVSDGTASCQQPDQSRASTREAEQGDARNWISI